MFENWVIDATMGYPFCFCPVRGDLHGEFEIVTGLNMIAAKLPGKLVGVVHADGQQAVDEFCEKYKAELSVVAGDK
jgi:hypothetical protein